MRDEGIILRLASLGRVSQIVASALCRVLWLIWSRHTRDLTCSRALLQSKKNRQGEKGDTLGPSDSDRKPDALLGRSFQIAACRTEASQSYTWTFGRCGTAECVHAEGPRERLHKGAVAHRVRKIRKRTKDEASSVKDSINTEVDKQCTSPLSARWTRNPMQNLRLTST